MNKIQRILIALILVALYMAFGCFLLLYDENTKEFFHTVTVAIWISSWQVGTWCSLIIKDKEN